MTQRQMMVHQQSTQNESWVMKRHTRKRKKTTTTTTPHVTTSEPNLPHDIIFFHILPKLPVKCLLRFNSVSKLWYNTIHDPKFHASHLTHAKSNPSLVALLSRDSYLICFLQLKEGGGHHHHPNSNNNNNIAYLELESGSGNSFGSCNGLTCNTIPSAIQICNPSTREVLNFPDPKPNPQTERNAAVSKGFGFDPLMNEYKVIQIWIDYREYYHCRVYTLGTNKWRDVTATCNYQPYCYPAELAPICISGTLFWGTNMPGRILSFDLHHEEFHLIACPKVPRGLILHTLSDLEGRLCLVYRCNDDLKDEIQLTLFTCEDHHQHRLMHIIKQQQQQQQRARWIRSGCIRLPLKPEIKQIRLVEFAKHIYLHWVTMDGHFILWDVNRKGWIYNKLLGLYTCQCVLLVKHVENLLSLKTFVPPSAGEAEVKYWSSRKAKHESLDHQQGEMKKKKRRRFVFDSHGYRATPYWLSMII